MAGPADDIEEIPDDAQISRLYFEPIDLLAPESYMPFMYDKDRDERAESVYWRKYAPEASDLHSRGAALEQPQVREYIGYRDSIASTIREIVTERGHSFSVIHYPQDGDLAHAHIAIVRKGGNVKKLSPPDRLRLTHELVKYFQELVACP